MELLYDVFFFKELCLRLWIFSVQKGCESVIYHERVYLLWSVYWQLAPGARLCHRRRTWAYRSCSELVNLVDQNKSLPKMAITSYFQPCLYL